MVSFSCTLPVMDSVKLSFSDQLVLCPRRKILSRFGFGIVLSFIVLSAVLFTNSSKGPFFNPVFQGLSSFGSHGNSSFLSWPFSRGFSSYSNSSSRCCENTSVVQNLQSPLAVNGTLETNVGSNRSSDFVNLDGKDKAFEDGQAKNVSEKSKDGSFIVVEESGGLGTNEISGLQPNRSAVLVDVSEKGIEQENASLGRSSARIQDEIVKGNEEGQIFSQNSTMESIEHEPTSNGTKVEASVNGNIRSNPPYMQCDIFKGRWVRDDTKPYYPPGSCPYIDRDFDCHLNGRTDNEFEKWKWQPNDCDIPRLNATDFLERLRGQKLVFVGDSLNRNMWESLVCVLRHGVKDKSRVYEISGRHEFKKKGFYAFRFEDFNCSIDFVSSPFLVKQSSFNGKNGSFETLRLDLMDETTSMYHDADVIIFNTGHWWTHEKTSRGEDYYQEGNYVHPRLKVMEAYKRALTTWASWVDKNIDRSKTQVIFRGYSVTHFRGGPWNSGGQCHKETEPIFNETHLAKYPLKMKALEYVLKGMNTPVTYLNISRLTDYRKDAHPSIYRPDYQATARQVTGMHAQDCSHWCLPGVPDTWNELLYVSLLKSGLGSWRH